MSQLGNFGPQDVRLGGAYVEIGIKGDKELQDALLRYQSQFTKLQQTQAQNLQTVSQGATASRGQVGAVAALAAVQVASSRAAIGQLGQQLALARQVAKATGTGAATASKTATAPTGLIAALQSARAQSRRSANAYATTGRQLATPAGQRAYGAAFTERADEVAKGLAAQRQGLGVEGGVYDEAIGKVRGIQPTPGTPGDKTKLIGFLREEEAITRRLADNEQRRATLSEQVRKAAGATKEGRADLYNSERLRYQAEQESAGRRAQQAELLRGALTPGARLGLAYSPLQARALRMQQTSALDAGLRASGQERLLGTEKAIQGEKARSRFAVSPEGSRMLREQVRLTKELTRAQSDTRWREMVAEQGKFGAGLSYINEQLVKFQSVATYTFAAGAAALTGFLSAASPSAVKTFTGSIEYLSIRLGEPFIPYLDAASRKLQQMGRWFEALSPEAKDATAKIVLFGIGASAAALALGRMAMMGKAAWDGLMWIRDRWFLTSFGTATVAVVGLTAAVAALGAAFYLTGNKAQDMGSRVDHLEAARQQIEANGKGPIDWRQKGNLSPESKTLLDRATASGERPKILQALELMQIRAQHGLEANPEELIERRVGQAAQMDAEARKLSPLNPFSGRAAANEERAKLLESFGIEGQLSRYRTGRGIMGTDEVEHILRARREQFAFEKAFAESGLKRQGMLPDGSEPKRAPDDGFKRSLAGLPSPAISSFEQYADRLQVAGLQPDDLENQNRMEQIRILSENKELLQTIRDNTANIRDLVPAYRGP
jgi:hypothetical protein